MVASTVKSAIWFVDRYRSCVWHFLIVSLAFSPSIHSARADFVVSTFEEATLASALNSEGAFKGTLNLSSQFVSGGVSFNNDGTDASGYWSGTGYSRRTTRNSSELYSDSNDLVAKPGVGAGAPGSQTWAVVYNSGLMTADPGYRFNSVQLTNTLYTWTTIVVGDPMFTDPLGPNDFFKVRFTDTTNALSFLEYNLADFAGSNSFVNDAWSTFDLSSLQASQLRIDFFGSDVGQFGLNTPAYVAMDNVTINAVPEPSSLLLLSSIMGALAVGRKRSLRRRSADLGESTADSVAG